VLALIVMLTQSRGAMLGLGVAVIMLPLISRRRARDIVVLTLALGGAALIAPKGVWERLAGLSNASVQTGMQDVDPEGSAAGRWQIWEIAAAEVRKHPVTGIGLGIMPQVNRWAALRLGLDWSVRGERDTHSTYLRIAAETGLPGLALYLVMWGLAIAKLSRTKKAIRHLRPREHQFLTFLHLSIIAFLVAAMFGTYFSLSFTYVMLAYIWLASDILSRHPWYVPQGVGASTAVPTPGDVPGRWLRRRPSKGLLT
jgi:O-antigen ligase